MSRLAIAIDLGTSGFRAHSVDLSTTEKISTAFTTRHPLPGCNVIDHIHFALELGIEKARGMIIEAVNRVIRELNIPVDLVDRLAVCGNPAQLSLFQGMEIRDLAYAGTRKLKSLGVITPDRKASIVPAERFAGLCLPKRCEVIIPPAVRHEVGADALAVIIKSGMQDRNEISIAIDYGTNAEMALFCSGKIITASTAAGPAIEGQHITCGMLAAPGAICDIIPEGLYHRLILIGRDMLPVNGPLADLREGVIVNKADCPSPAGITGTGLIASISEAVDAGLVAVPSIRTSDGRIFLGEGVYLTGEDLLEAGKAAGSVRAGYITLCSEMAIEAGDIKTVYMAGASGTYVDAIKAQKLGLIPPHVRSVFQIGNTSLAMACDLATDPESLGRMTDLADRLKDSHCMLAQNETFRKVYILELSHWTEGMPMSLYRNLLHRYSLPDLPSAGEKPDIIHTVKRDIDDLGAEGLAIIRDIGRKAEMSFTGCTACRKCEKVCPEKAMTALSESEPATLSLIQSKCRGVACRRCERRCPEKVFVLDRFFS
jgi:methylamine methyltransferase corrinoid protein reductive activase